LVEIHGACFESWPTLTSRPREFLSGRTQAAAQPQAKRKTAAAPAKESKPKKLKTDRDEDLAKSLDGRRSSARSRDVSGAKGRQMKALAELKRQRKIQQDFVEESSESDIDFDDDDDSDDDYQGDEKAQAAKPWQSKGKAKASSDGDGSDMDVDDDDDDKDDKVNDANAAMEAALADFQKITVPRRRLERWCNEPYFKDAVLNCYVRMFIGEDDNGDKQYRLCEIVDVMTGKKTYKFPRTEENATPTSTDKTIKVRFGTSEREFQMYLVSDAIPNESDVQKYVSSQKNHRLEVISKRRAAQLRRMQDQLVGNYTYTTEDIERNLKERKKKGKVIGSNLGSEQTRVMIAVQAAKDALAEAEGRLALAKRVLIESSEISSEQRNAVEEWTKKTEEARKVLDDRLKDQKALTDALSDRKKKLSRRTKDQNWAKVNQRALELNQKADRQGYRAQKEVDARKAAGEKEKFNPYARRKVKPKILWEVGQAPDGKDGAEKGGVEPAVPAGPSENAAVATAPAENMSPALINEVLAPLTTNNDFTIDEEGLAHSSLETLGLRDKQPNRNRLRKGISLAEYFDRREKGTL
jgi:RNA polymerase-associated protein RTF1